MSIGVDRVWLAKSLACFHERKKTPQSKAAALEKFRTTETLNIAFLNCCSRGALTRFPEHVPKITWGATSFQIVRSISSTK
jgi:hypothetical protein